jgi:hypothetical protein
VVQKRAAMHGGVGSLSGQDRRDRRCVMKAAR